MFGQFAPTLNFALGVPKMKTYVTIRKHEGIARHLTKTIKERHPTHILQKIASINKTKQNIQSKKKKSVKRLQVLLT